MAQFTATGAAVHGFALLRQAPATVAALALLHGGFSVWTTIALAKPLTGYMLTALASQSPDQAARRQAAGALLAASPPYLVAWLVLMAVTHGAVQRRLVRGEPGGLWLGLDLGLDELRLIGVSVAVFGLVLGVELLGGQLAALLGAGGGAGAAVGALISGAALALVLVLLVRLSPAWAATIGEGRLSIAMTWRITRGAFWAILAAHLLALLISGLGLLLALVVSAAVAPPPPELAPDKAADLDPEALQRHFVSAGNLVAQALAGAIMLTASLGQLGVGALAYKAFKDKEQA